MNAININIATACAADNRIITIASVGAHNDDTHMATAMPELNKTRVATIAARVVGNAPDPTFLVCVWVCVYGIDNLTNTANKKPSNWRL